MSYVIDFNDKYFSLTSKDSILSSSAWNTLSITSSNNNVITATGTAGANNIDYKFDVKKLAEPAKATSSVSLNKDSKLVDDLKATKDAKFKIAIGTNEKGEAIYSKDITIEDNDTIETLISKINNSNDGVIKASYSEMTGKFTIESTKTGDSSGFAIVDETGKNISNSLDFLGLQTNSYAIDSNGTTQSNFTGVAVGSNSIIEVSSKDGTFTKTLNEESNTFTIDG